MKTNRIQPVLLLILSPLIAITLRHRYTELVESIANNRSIDELRS